MPNVIVPGNLAACQVDDFGADVERSVKGALHFHPSSTKQITDGEWEHLKAKHSKLASMLQVVPEGAKAKAEKAPESVVEAVEAAAESTEAPAPKSKKQRW